MTSATTGGATGVVTAALMVIGDEILSGRTKDKNIGYVADHCTTIGIQLREVRIVADVEDEIVTALNALRAKFDYVFTTGGIGPTHDDITADAVAKAFGVTIGVDQRALDLMLPYYKKRNLELTPARLRMARIPAGGVLLENSISIAPGFMIGNVVVMAGVPNVMQVMLDSATKLLRTGKRMHSTVIDLYQPEGTIASMLEEHQKLYPEVPMGSYPFFRDGRLGTQLVLRSTEPDRLDKADRELRDKLLARGWLTVPS